ncbi:hypothetical protein [Jiella marina]|uniref:hypothetical protein n=1 Tax=Jiella sp. LLJ827 TaxID=2917712 RepID=UPI0021019C17|nr:hypothetical protein [Jiella sp. LLJ827]MCQ0987521.1 hypothetical protein [Jiella sp. LLJ827]
MSAAELAALLATARALSEAVTYDDSGKAGRGGNGGLLSRETIRKNDELKIALSRFEAAEVPIKVEGDRK